MTQLIGLSQRNTWNFFGEFFYIPFSRNDVSSAKIAIRTSKNIFIHVIWALTRAQNLTLSDSTDKSQSEEYLEFFREFFYSPFSRKNVRIPNVPLTENHQSSHLTSNLVPQMVKSRVYKLFFKFGLHLFALFCTLKVVSGEWYGEKIPERIASVPLTEIYQSSHLRTNFVSQQIPNHQFPKLKNVKITFFQRKTQFSAEKYERKIPEKILRFSFSSIYS